jgi:hypothetical protein
VPPDAVIERWSGWEAAGAVHVSFAVLHWPAQPPADVLSALSHVPHATAVDTAVALRPPTEPDEPLPVRATIRVAAAPDRLAASIEHLLATAARLGVRLGRLDGEQGTAAYATAPTGLALGASPW